MYDKHVKQTRSGKKTVISVSKVKKMPTRKSMVCILKCHSQLD